LATRWVTDEGLIGSPSRPGQTSADAPAPRQHRPKRLHRDLDGAPSVARADQLGGPCLDRHPVEVVEARPGEAGSDPAAVGVLAQRQGAR
jgi:hypothetical protein